jgi:hypothetical protein
MAPREDEMTETARDLVARMAREARERCGECWVGSSRDITDMFKTDMLVSDAMQNAVDELGFRPALAIYNNWFASSRVR